MTEPQSVGQKIRMLRRRRLMSAKDLAARSGISVVTISNIERDKLQTEPRPSTLRKLADALDVPYEELFLD